MIYPSEKVKPEIEPFRTLHNEFISDVNRCNILIFIGFAFRDEYINSILNDAGKKYLIIISPHDSDIIKKPNGNASKFKRTYAIDASFGKAETINELQKTLASIDLSLFS